MQEIPLDTEGGRKTEQLLCVFVLIRTGAGCIWWQQNPYCFTRRRPRRSGAGPSSQALVAAAAPAQPQVKAHLQAVISRVICPDSVCLWTSPESTGHWEETPGGGTYEYIHHRLQNIIDVTATGREARAPPRQLQSGFLLRSGSLGDITIHLNQLAKQSS